MLNTKMSFSISIVTSRVIALIHQNKSFLTLPVRICEFCNSGDIQVHSHFMYNNGFFWFDTLNLRLSVVCFEGSHVKFQILFLFLNFSEDQFYLSKQCNYIDPDEMLHCVAFPLCLHCLPKY